MSTILSQNYKRLIVLLATVIAFVVIISPEGYCDYGLNPHINFTLFKYITVDPALAYTGQTITIRGSGFNTTPYPGDSEPIVFCNAYCYTNGTMKPIKVQADGTFVVQPAPNAPGEADIYAKDRWGSESNKVRLKVTYPVTFNIKIFDTAGKPYATNGVLCIRYPASSGSHYENSIIGPAYTTRMALNGTSAEFWVRQSPLTTNHVTVPNIEEGKAYSVNLTMPVPTPTPSASPSAQAGTPTPSQGPQASTPGSPSPAPPGAPDTIAPVTVLNFTGVKDSTGVYTSNVVCTLTATDNDGGSGVNGTSYSFDGNNWTAYTGPFTIIAPGNTTVFYSSIDRAGNREVARIETVAIAGTAAGQQGSCCGPALLLPLLMAGTIGLYGMKRRV